YAFCSSLALSPSASSSLSLHDALPIWFGFDSIVETREREGARPIHAIRIRGGLREHLRFFLTVRPAIRRKRDFGGVAVKAPIPRDRKSTRLNSSHEWISYAVFCLKKKK